MTETCCNHSSSGSGDESLDQSRAVDARYGFAANEKEACLCSPVSFDPQLLKAIPKDVVEKDYGCGDPTRWVKRGDKVLDLGSGSGKNAFICAQVVGPSGKVLGVDQNVNMLEVAMKAAPIVAERIGFLNTFFLKGAIEHLDKPKENGDPLIQDSSIDIVLSNCVLNLVNPSQRESLLKNIRRVLKPSGRVAISDIVSDREVPLALKEDPELWSGCISGAWEEEKFLEDFRALGFQEVIYADRSKTPWKVIEGINFRAVTLIGHL